MGQFRVEIEGVGGHGCSREIGDGETLPKMPHVSWGQCPDCDARKLVDAYKASGIMNLKATLTHWPSEPGEVVDDLVSGARRGAFPERDEWRRSKG